MFNKEIMLSKREMNAKAFFRDDDILLFEGDCLEILPKIKPNSITTIFADPPYNLSNGGITCKAGKMVSVNKGDWDKSQGMEKDFQFTLSWIKACREVLKPEGTIWISGTMHNIYQVGFALQTLGFQIINEIIWYKPNAPPNLACKCFAHSHETLIWARKNKGSKNTFNYEEMKQLNDKFSVSGKQMRSLWNIPLTPPQEKTLGKHPTQKPLELLKRIILSSSKPGDIILDPFNGSGTSGVVAKTLGRRYIGIEKERNYLEITLKRLKYSSPLHL